MNIAGFLTFGFSQHYTNLGLSNSNIIERQISFLQPPNVTLVSYSSIICFDFSPEFDAVCFHEFFLQFFLSKVSRRHHGQDFAE
jgi:hypothetical protein